MHLDVLAAVRYLRKNGAKTVAVMGGISGAMRLAEASKIKCQNPKACSHQRFRLRLPALLCKTPAMRKHHPAIPVAIHVGVDEPTVFCGKGDVLYR